MSDRVQEIRAPREIELLRKTLAMLAHFIWNGKIKPGEPLWTLPADRERDWDFILSDAIDELEKSRNRVTAQAARIAELETRFNVPCPDCTGVPDGAFTNGFCERCGRIKRAPTRLAALEPI